MLGLVNCVKVQRKCGLFSVDYSLLALLYLSGIQDLDKSQIVLTGSKIQVCDICVSRTPTGITFTNLLLLYDLEIVFIPLRHFL